MKIFSGHKFIAGQICRYPFFVSFVIVGVVASPASARSLEKTPTLDFITSSDEAMPPVRKNVAPHPIMLEDLAGRDLSDYMGKIMTERGYSHSHSLQHGAELHP